MLDCISGGRLVAGFPVGTSMDTNYCYGQIPALTREKYAEAHDLIMRAWTTREPFAFNGRYNKLRHVNIWPRPIQQPHPPIHIPGGGSVETYDFCIDNTYSYSYLSFTGYIRAQALMDGLLGPRRRAQRARQLALSRRLRPDHLRRRHRRGGRAALLAEHVNYFYNRCLHVYPGFADAPGYRTIKTIQTGALSQYAPPRGGLRRADLEGPDRRRPRHRRQPRDRAPAHGGADQGRCMSATSSACMHVGDMPADKCMYSTKLFAEKVMPKLRNMFPECGERRPLLVPSARASASTPGRCCRADSAPGAAPRQPVPARVRGIDHGIENRRRRRTSPVRYLEGGTGEPLVFLHGAGGMTRGRPVPQRARRALPRLRAAAARATATPRNAPSCATCSTSRCTPGTWSRRWA